MMATGKVIYNPGDKMKVIMVEIRNDVFLKTGSFFLVTLQSVFLIGTYFKCFSFCDFIDA